MTWPVHSALIPARARDRNGTLLEVLGRTATPEPPGWYLSRLSLPDRVERRHGPPARRGHQGRRRLPLRRRRPVPGGGGRGDPGRGRGLRGPPRRGRDPQRGPRPPPVRAEVRRPVRPVHLHRGRDRQLRRDHLLPGRPPHARRPVARPRSARACPTCSGSSYGRARSSRRAPCTREDRAPAPTVAGADRAGVAHGMGRRRGVSADTPRRQQPSAHLTSSTDASAPPDAARWAG